jgi:hypothetical protein
MASMMAKSRKRRPGGGRKPKGSIRGKGSNFSTRITAETREALEREASASGQSISQVAERLLMLGLEERRQRAANRPLRALCYVIEQIALRASEGRYVKYPDDLAAEAVRMRDMWRTDRFRFVAFKIAVGMLLDAVEPRGEMQSPFPGESIDEFAAEAVEFFGVNPAVVELLKSAYKSPESLAAYIFSNVWAQLNRAHDLSERERELLRHGKWVGDAIREEFYALADARVDLNLGSKGEEE